MQAAHNPGLHGQNGWRSALRCATLRSEGLRRKQNMDSHTANWSKVPADSPAPASGLQTRFCTDGNDRSDSIGHLEAISCETTGGGWRCRTPNNCLRGIGFQTPRHSYDVTTLQDSFRQPVLHRRSHSFVAPAATFVGISRQRSPIMHPLPCAPGRTVAVRFRRASRPPRPFFPR